jgi:small subunit ribosomal protein S16
VGATPTDTVRSLLRRAGVLKARHEARLAAKLQASAVALPEGGAEG